MTRIVFVDDEPRVLEGLRLGLRGRRKQWQMVFVESGKQALTELEKEPADVVVTDMRMPGMDGAEFLARVQLIRPEAVRIVLSGQMDEGAASRAANVAHRFLTKPCDSAAVEATIARAIELNAWLHCDRLRSSIGGLEKLPSLPGTFLELTQTLAKSNASLQDVAFIIQKDTAMAAKILQLVNSAFFGLSRSIVSVAQAVSYLGVNTMKGLVLANSIFRAETPENVVSVERQQRHALLCARLAKRFSSGGPKGDAAFTAALLHDAGDLALRSRMLDDYLANREDATLRRVSLHEAEKERFGVSHAEVGAYLLGLWGLPHEIVEAVARHHAPLSEFTTLDVGAAVAVADVLADEADDQLDEASKLELQAAVERFHLSEVVNQFGLEARLGSAGQRP